MEIIQKLFGKKPIEDMEKQIEQKKIRKERLKFRLYNIASAYYFIDDLHREVHTDKESEKMAKEQRQFGHSRWQEYHDRISHNIRGRLSYFSEKAWKKGQASGLFTEAEIEEMKESKYDYRLSHQWMKEYEKEQEAKRFPFPQEIVEHGWGLGSYKLTKEEIKNLEKRHGKKSIKDNQKELEKDYIEYSINHLGRLYDLFEDFQKEPEIKDKQEYKNRYAGIKKDLEFELESLYRDASCSGNFSKYDLEELVWTHNRVYCSAEIIRKLWLNEYAKKTDSDYHTPLPGYHGEAAYPGMSYPPLDRT